MDLKKPELLSPAGNLKKLKLACDYGADAVYIGGTRFGLRKAADNFSIYEMNKGLEYAHVRGKKVYVVLNGIAHNGDLDNIITAVKELDKIKPDAFIISDLGVASLAKGYSDVAIHTSTQASVLNWRSANIWKAMGATRVVVGRELTLEQCNQIHKKTGLEIETFVHGSMCISHSGKCHISNYFSGRDSNRGGCIQSCRYRYDFNIDDKDYSTTLMNARDILTIGLMPEIIKNNICSLKIEGRMKSELYIATAVKNYRKAIDICFENIQFNVQDLTANLEAISNRGFTTGNLINKAGVESINFESAGYTRSASFMGTVKGFCAERGLAVEVRENINIGDTIYCISPNGKNKEIKVTSITNLNGAVLERATPNKMAWIKSDYNPGVGALLQKNLIKPMRMS